MSSKSSTPSWQPFVSGGLSSMTAAVITHPIDLVKVRMQLSGEGVGSNAVKMGTVQTLTHVARSEGVKAVYKGLSASLLRQATYSSARIGIYNSVAASLKETDGSITFLNRVAAGLIGGGCGAFIGTPADLVMVRMQADGRLPPEQRRNYKNAIDGFARLIREESFTSLWKGCGPTVVRAMVVTAAQLVTYDVAKDNLIEFAQMKDGLLLHFSSSMIAGLSAAFFSSPVDVIKTRVMNQKEGQYKNAIDCLLKTVRSEGPFALYKGFLPNYIRIGPHTVITFLVMEQINKGIKWYMSQPAPVQTTTATTSAVDSAKGKPTAAAPSNRS